MVLEESVPTVQDDLPQEVAAVDDPSLAVAKAEDQRGTGGEVTHNSDAILRPKRKREALDEGAHVNRQYVRGEREQISERKIQLVAESVVEKAELEREQSQGRNASALADEWFSLVDTLHITMGPNDNEPSYDAVKIALLDTGLSARHVHAPHISGWKDFVDESDAKTDKTGHGSMGVDMIYKLLPRAQVFVARVFENAEAGPRTQDLMVKAIRHARESWRVNIIVLASGFESDHDDMRDEIVKAKGDRILVFAAASNHGNVTRISFPARMRYDVMCMFASDGNVKATTVNFNPSPSEHHRYNFAIFGKEVRSPTLAGSPWSGTSISALIAAAIAGLVIDFSRQSDCEARIFNRKNLFTIEGMSAVFAAMAVNRNDSGYHCVAPWVVLDHFGPHDNSESRDEKRGWLCDTISRILENME